MSPHIPYQNSFPAYANRYMSNINEVEVTPVKTQTIKPKVKIETPNYGKHET